MSSTGSESLDIAHSTTLLSELFSSTTASQSGVTSQPETQSQTQSQPPSEGPSGSSPSYVPIPLTAPAGGITITNPPQTATSFYKIAPGEVITFAWNITSVLATPTHLTVLAICDNGNTYPVGSMGGIIPGTATEVAWDLFSYQQNNPNTPLAQASYTLNIWDDRGPGAPVRPGYVQQNNELHFAMYTPQVYVGIGDGWTCSGCNSALAFSAHPASVSMLITFIIAFFSGFHLLRAARTHL